MPRMSEASHPIWPLIRQVVNLAALSLFLMMNASEFDITELKTIIAMFLYGGASEGLLALRK